MDRQELENRISEIRERWARATPGPWRECGADRGGCQCGIVWSVKTEFPVASTDIDSEDEGIFTSEERKIINARAIAAAPSDIEFLLTIAENELHRLETEWELSFGDDL